jgi:hypothetical protein
MRNLEIRGGGRGKVVEEALLGFFYRAKGSSARE